MKPTAHAGAVEPGRALYERRGCAVCHSLDGSRLTGPSFLAMNALTDAEGRELVVDRASLERSLFEPGAFVVVGYPAIMPSFRGAFAPEEIDDLAAFLAFVAERRGPR